MRAGTATLTQTRGASALLYVPSMMTNKRCADLQRNSVNRPSCRQTPGQEGLIFETHQVPHADEVLQILTIEAFQPAVGT